MGYTDNPREKCANCKFCKELWWWVYKEDGKHLDHKEYGHVCTLFANEGSYWKMDYTDGLCECFTDVSDTHQESLKGEDF